MLVLAPAAASAAPAVNGEFSVSETPGHLALGPDGNIWVALGNKKIAKVTPGGAVTEYSPAAITGTLGSITANPDGNLWVTQAGGGDDGVVKIPPGNPNGAVKTNIAGLTDARGLTTGPDNNLWAASLTKVFKIPPANPATATFFTVLVGARGIARGNDGQLWVADFGGSGVVSVTTGGVAKNYNTGGGPQEVFAGPGTQIGYTNPGATPESVGRISPGGTPQPSFPTGGGDPFGITFGNDGAYWIARFATNDLLRMTSNGQLTTLSGFSAASGPRQITKGPGDTLWVSLETAKKIARVTGVSAPVPPPPPPNPIPAQKPSVSLLKISPSTFALGTLLPRLTRAVKVGTTISFRLDQAAKVKLAFEQALPGRRVGRKCRAPSRSNRRKRKCTRYKAVKTTISLNGHLGKNKVRFQGRLSRRRKLSPGRYRLTVTATSAARLTSRAVRASFTLKPAPRPRRRR